MMLLELINGNDNKRQSTAFVLLLEKMEKRVDFACEIWDLLLEDLSSFDVQRRARAGQMLSYLAISDSDERMLEDFYKIWTLTYDQNYTIASQVLQSTWRIGLCGGKQQNLLIEAYKMRFEEALKKGSTNEWIRYTLIENLWKLYTINQDELVRVLVKRFVKMELQSKSENKFAKSRQFNY